MRKRFGLTLVEIIAVVALMGIVTIIGFNVLRFSLRSLDGSLDEFQFQSDVRRAASLATNRIRHASAVFTIPEGSFREDNLAPNWHYYGVQQGTKGAGPSSRIVNFIWNPSTQKHDRTEIAPFREGITYRMVFSKDSDLFGDSLAENSLLDFDIVGFVRGNNFTPYMTVEGATLGANSLQTVDNGTDLHQATAIAYRHDSSNAYVAHIALVLDCSGSMGRDINDLPSGNPGFTPPIRMDILKEAATDMIHELSAHSNVDMVIIEFETDANHGGLHWIATRRPKLHIWRNVQQDTAGLIDQIETMNAAGNTNTGDGIRRAYYELLDHGNALTAGEPKRYMILMVDGDTNTASIEPTTFQLDFPLDKGIYRYGRGNVRPYHIGTVMQNGRHIRVGLCETYAYGSIAPTANPIAAVMTLQSTLLPFAAGYVTAWGQKIMEDDFVIPYVVVFTSTVTPAGVLNVRSAFNLAEDDEKFFHATQLGQLEGAFADITESIINDLWRLNGPGL